MRPLRFLLSLVCCLVGFFLLLNHGPWHTETVEAMEERGHIGAYFNWRMPSSSLFPPSAIISLTDDNSTFFLARPAAFGPVLPVKSLSGQLWIGSGFGDDHLGRGGSGAGAEGELGCSDVPGWYDGDYLPRSNGNRRLNAEVIKAAAAKQANGKKKGKRSLHNELDEEDITPENHPEEADGTDDHLHHPLPASDGLKTNGDSMRSTKKPTHADIQSLQEGAEIAGKIVLLSRGGCGFLEKVKWVQRRGGVALIVGDDIRGGQLVTMYARGDTSNVSIPALFTSHTTAHLLSSLIPSGGLLEEVDDTTRLGLALGEKQESTSSIGQDDVVEEESVITSSGKATSKPTPDVSTQPQEGDHRSKAKIVDESREGWFAAFFGIGSGDTRKSNTDASEREKVRWILQKAPKNKGLARGKADSPEDTNNPSPSADSLTMPRHGSNDGFVIGIDDWRDPDLVMEQLDFVETTSSSSSSQATSGNSATTTSLDGGSITPGSGEYEKADKQSLDILKTRKSSERSNLQLSDQDETDESSHGWLSRFLSRGGQTPAAEDARLAALKAASLEKLRPQGQQRRPQIESSLREAHDGLWITLTPTSMSSSPFFDTLLVLVVSPLVTLTVVYALLLLRSRIRRRRWRAPKSVVERLPVRTYQTMPSTTTTSSTTSSISSPATATTPLLPPRTRSVNTRSRPRSRTTPEVPVASSSHGGGAHPPSLEQIEEKRAAGLAEWRRKYGGKQRECVVCLEEYIDGVSRVMSLPCGHEFHAECITPWLTTRRRTCPICKGDVVRSLASATSPQEPYEDREDMIEDEDSIQEQAATTVNEDPASAQPVSREDEAFEDLERGIGIDRNR